MTPILFGRWQSRIFLLGTVGVLVTQIISRLLAVDVTALLVILGYVLLFGLLWDAIYILLQSFRWDRDWPPAFVLFTGVFEALVLWALLSMATPLPGLTTAPSLTTFLIHYSSVWLATFIMLFGPMRILFPRWRWYGGRIV